MFGFGESKDAYEQIDSMDAHHPSFSHELIAGAAGKPSISSRCIHH